MNLSQLLQKYLLRVSVTCTFRLYPEYQVLNRQTIEEYKRVMRRRRKATTAYVVTALKNADDKGRYVEIEDVATGRRRRVPQFERIEFDLKTKRIVVPEDCNAKIYRRETLGYKKSPASLVSFLERKRSEKNLSIEAKGAFTQVLDAVKEQEDEPKDYEDTAIANIEGGESPTVENEITEYSDPDSGWEQFVDTYSPGDGEDEIDITIVELPDDSEIGIRG